MSSENPDFIKPDEDVVVAAIARIMIIRELAEKARLTRYESTDGEDIWNPWFLDSGSWFKLMDAKRKPLEE